ncbi:MULTISPECIES: hypothetical protein [unclassified Streptomyces]|uniref:hypothetical protein n=1 Tax=unclassified Streptomyces TaxID=2593676 RepID=UPI0038016170
MTEATIIAQRPRETGGRHVSVHGQDIGLARSDRFTDHPVGFRLTRWGDLQARYVLIYRSLRRVVHNGRGGSCEAEWCWETFEFSR